MIKKDRYGCYIVVFQLLFTDYIYIYIYISSTLNKLSYAFNYITHIVVQEQILSLLCKIFKSSIIEHSVIAAQIVSKSVYLQ